jgi:transcriptional regulator with XRE-family HTH domain
MAKKRTTGFGARLRELRTHAGLTQADLAERSGLHIQSLTKLELGQREPAWATVVDLAQALGISCEAFNQVPAEREPTGPGRPRKAEAEASGEKPVESKPSKAPGGSKGKRSGKKSVEEPGGKPKAPRKRKDV